MQVDAAEDDPQRLVSQNQLARAYWGNDQITEALEVLKPVVTIKQTKYDAGHPSRSASEKMLAAILKEKEELALDRRSHSDSSSGPGESNPEIQQSDELLAEDVLTSASRQENRDRLEQHPVPVSRVPPSELGPVIKPSKRERLQMALRLRRK